MRTYIARVVLAIPHNIRSGAIFRRGYRGRICEFVCDRFKKNGQVFFFFLRHRAMILTGKGTRRRGAKMPSDAFDRYPGTSSYCKGHTDERTRLRDGRGHRRVGGTPGNSYPSAAVDDIPRTPFSLVSPSTAHEYAYRMHAHVYVRAHIRYGVRVRRSVSPEPFPVRGPPVRSCSFNPEASPPRPVRT
jgi:hypothetical protein